MFSNGIHLKDDAGPVNQIFIDNRRFSFSQTNGIAIDSPTHVLRDITIMRCYIRSYAGWGIWVQANSPSVGVNQPVILDGFIRNDIGLGGVHVSTSDPDVHNLITILNIERFPGLNFRPTIVNFGSVPDWEKPKCGA